MRLFTKRVFIAVAVIFCAVLALKGSTLLISSGTWQATGNLSVARAGTSGALLQDGRILVTGGDPGDGTGPRANADLFNTDGTISPASPMTHARSGHISVTLQNGKVLVAGGITAGGSATSTAEVFDPIENSWTPMGLGMNEARSGATAALLSDGRVLIVGGQNGTAISSTIEIFNPALGVFTSAGMTSSPRTQHAMTVLQDGRVLIVGGNNGTAPVASTDIFDPVAGTVTAGPILNTARFGHSATTLLNGVVVVIGGNNGNANPAQVDVTPAEMVDFTAATPAFTTLATNLATPREGHLAVLLPNNNNILIAGGTSAGSSGVTTVASAELFTPQESPQGVWTYGFGTTGTMTAARSAAAASANQVNAPSSTMQRNGVVMVAGGNDASGNALNTTEAYGYPTVQTDQSDYPPGTTVTITGSGFQPLETIAIQLVESPVIDTHGPYTVQADANGNFADTSFTTDLHDVNIQFYLSATGGTSGFQAQNTFTDSKPNTVTLNPTSVTVAPGSSAQYTVTVNFNGNNNSCTSPLSITTALPAGATASFNPSSVTSTGGNVNSTLTISTTNATPPGSTTFTVLAANGGGTCQAGTATNTGTLNIVESTTTTLGSSPNPSTFGQSVTLTATVAQVTGPTTPNAGTVTFKDGANTLGTGTLNASGVATLAVSTLTAGSHSLTASYAGTALFGASNSNTVSQTVNQASTTTTVTSSVNPSTVGQSVTFTATVTDSSTGSTGTPTGTVTFKDGAATLGTGTLNGSGQATFTTTTLTAGAHSITAVYGGDTNFTTSTSSAITQTVIAPPTITKSFGAATIPLNGIATLSFTITNPAANTVSLTGVAFTDTLPAGLVVATPNGLTGTCGGGTITATQNTGSVSLSGATLTTTSPNNSCTFSVNVTGTTAGVKNNAVTVSSTNGGTGNTSNASITVVAPPTISKTFGGATVPLNGNTSLSFTITNPNTTQSLSSIAFSDTLPAGLVVSTPNGQTGTCGGGTITATAGGSSISLSGATLTTTSPNNSCTFSVNVTGTTTGVKNNTTTAISSTEGGTGGTASATLTVVAPPTITKLFGAATIPLNGSTSLTFTITNPAANTVSLTGVAFSDPLPTGLQVSAPNGLTGSCGGGDITATPNSTTISLSAATLAAGASCTFSVNVTGTTAGVKNNAVTVSSTNGGTGNTSNASITVLSPPTISKAFGAATIPLNGTTSLTFSITNPAANAVSLTGVAFTDALPAGLVVATPNGLTGSCDSGTITATQNTGSISLSGATLTTTAPNNSCTFSVNVTGTTAGAKNNSVTVTSTNGGTGNTSTATVTVASPPTISKTFGAATIALNGSTSLSFTITNPNTTQSLSGIAFSDSLPAGLVVSTPNGLTGTCGGGTITAAAGSGSISLSGATLATSGSCTFSVNVTGTTAGVKNNTTTAISSTEGGTGGTASASVTVAAPPTISKTFGAASIPLNGTTTLSFTITNPGANTVSLTGVAFTDTLPAGLIVSTPNNGLTGTCSGGTITATAGSGSISLSGATLAANSSCTFSVNVTGTTSGVKNNTTGAVTSTNGGTGNTASASITVASPPTISKAFGAASIPLNASTSLSFTINNSNTISLTGVAFSDSLPAGLVVATPNVLSSTCGGATTAVAGSGSASLSGGTVAASSSCSISLSVTGTTTGVKNNTTGVVSATESGPGAASNTAMLTVNARTTSTTIAPLTATAAIGQGTNFTVTVTDTDSGPASTPGGSVVVSSSNGTDSIGPCALTQTVPGTATCTATVTPAGPTGTHNISASYPGDNVHAGSSTTTSAALTVINAATTTTVTSSANPSVFGQGVNFKATVTPQQSGLGTPTGTVQFAVDGGSFGSPVALDATGSATSGMTSTLSVGTHTVTATYFPASGSVYQGSTSPTLTQTVNEAGTTTMIMPSPNPSTFGQNVTITVTVAVNAPGTGTPTGSVAFAIDGNGSTLTLIGGSATVMTSSLAVGSHSITATYMSDGNFTASMASATQVVNQATTSTALMLNPSTINYGQSTTVTATVSDTSMGSTGTPTGSVSVSDGIGNATGDSCTITLSGGTGTCVLTPSATAPGGSTVTGTYSGDPSFQGSTGTTSLTVNAATTQTTLASTPNASILGQAVAFTATVTDTSSGDTAVPNGTVNFYDGVMLIGSATLNPSGYATFTTSLLSSSASPHSITAAFNGNANFSASTSSSPVSQAVNPRSTSTAVVGSPTQVVVGQASTVTVTVTDTATTGPAGTPGAFTLAAHSLNTPRTGHASVLLPYGTVLIAGGQGTSGVLGSAEIYDPVAGSFTPLTATLSAARTGATATLLNNGTVLIVGGSGDGTAVGALTSAEIYDPVAGTFTALTGAGQSLTTARFGHTATLLSNGKVLIAGGQNGSGTLTTMEIFDPSGQTFTAISDNLSVARAGHTATLLLNSTILFAGGSGLASAEIYDPIAHTLIGTGSMTTDRTNHAAVLLPDGNVLIAGGTSSGSAVNTTELYNTAAGTFVATGNMQKARSGLTATILDSAQVLVVGGSNAAYPALASAELYTPSFDPLGTVNVTSSDNTDSITGNCPLTLSGTGATTCQITDTPSQVGTGTHTLTAQYQPAPDQVHTGSSGMASLTVTKADTTTSVASSASPSTYGQAVTFTATVGVVPPGSGTPTGTVDFKDGSTTLAAGVVLSGGQATLTTTATQLAAGTHSITAVYSGDSNFNATGTGASTATAFSQVVKPAATSTTVSSSANPSIFGQSVTFTATVANTAGPSVSTATPTGSVQFYIDGSAFGSPVAVSGSGATATGVSGAIATLTVSGSPHSVKATYTNTDGNFTGSYGSLTGGQTVSPAPTSTTVSSSVNPSIYGQPVTFTATVMNTAAAGVSTATPTGSVQFYVDSVAFGSPVTISGSGATSTGTSGATATLTVSGSPHAIKATYTNSDGNFSGSYGSLAGGQIVNKADTTSVVTSNYNQSVYGQLVKFTATVSDISLNSTGTPTGTVTFMDGATTLTSGVMLSGGQATYTTSALAAATHSITAVYSGDGNFNGSGTGASTDPAFSQIVNPAPLTITASSGSMTYGSTSPVMVGPLYIGPNNFVNGEGPNVLTPPPTCGPVFTAATSPGTYFTSCSGAADPNYTISYVMGSVVVSQANTNTAVISSLNPSNWGNVVALTATVSDSSTNSTGAPTGTVSFYNNIGTTCPAFGTITPLDTEPLSLTSPYTASTSTPSLPVGTDTILACYNGDINFYATSTGNGTTTTLSQAVIAAPIATLSPANLSFGGQQGGTVSGAQIVYVCNGPSSPNCTTAPVSTAALLITGIGFTNPNTGTAYFTQTNNCPSSLGVGYSCAINVKFAPPPNAQGIATALLTVTDNNENVPGSTQSASLVGAGTSAVMGVGSLSTYAIFGTANGCSTVNVSGNGTVDSFGGSTTSGNIGTNGNVTLSGNPVVSGAVYSPVGGTGSCSSKTMTGLSTSGKAQATGGLQALTAPVNYPLPSAPNSPTTTQNISGSCGSIGGCSNNGSKNVILAPGQYGNLNISGGTIVNVSGGTYNINSLTLSGNSALVVTPNTGPVVVNLAGKSLSGGNAALDLSGGSMSNSSGMASNLQFYYAGSQSIKLSGGTGSYAVVYAPNAPINVSGGSHFYGSIIGSTVNSSGNTAIHYPTTLPSLSSPESIWFSSSGLTVKGLPNTGSVKLYVTNASINFMANGTTYNLPVPNAVITFSSTATSASTTWDATNNRWSTIVPTSSVNNVASIHTFFDGVAYQVPSGGFPTGIQNVTWQAAYSTSQTGLSFNWQWGAAVYSSFTNNYSSLTVNPIDNNPLYGSDPAGTPENYRSNLVFGDLGAGYTGLYANFVGVVPTIAPMNVAPSSYDFGVVAVSTPTTASVPFVLTNNDSVSYIISTIQMTGTYAGDFGQTNTCGALPVTLPGGGSCTFTVTFTPSASSGTKETAKIVINDNANNSPQTVFFKGTVQ